MSSFLSQRTPAVAHRGLGFFEVLIGLANTGVSAYLQKEEARRADLAAARAASLERQRQEAVAIQQQQQALEAQQQTDVLGISSTVASVTNSPTNLALVGAAGLGLLYLLTRR